MASSGWKLTVTLLGAEGGAREIPVRADNWLDALREGRRQLGEIGGVPAGASCSFGLNGAVTVLDPTQRRRYMLAPMEEGSPSSSMATPGRAIAVAPSQRPPGEPSAGQLGPQSMELSPTQPAPPPGLRAETADAQSPPGRSKQTLDFSPERAEALRREYELARARSITPPPQGGAQAPEETGWSRPNLRAISAAEDSRQRANDASRRDAARSSLPPPAAALQSGAARVSGEQPKARSASGSVYGLRSDGLALLTTRDLEPTASSPLTYRERAYVLAGKADRVRLEVLLQAELAQIRRELAGHPRGQFVRLGVFMEPFEGAPSRPPYATLEWKDWRGRATFQLTEEQVPSESESSFPPPPPELIREQASPARAAPEAAPSTEFAPQSPGPRESESNGSASRPPPSASREFEEAVPSEAWGSDAFALLDGRSSEPDLRLATAFEAITDLYLLTTPLSGLQFAVELLERLVPCEAISGCLYDADTNEFRFVALSGAGAVERKASAIRASSGLFGAAQRREVLLVSDVREEPRYNAAIDGRPGLGTRDIAYVPVRHQGQLLGMLQLINASSEAGFAQGDVPVLTYVAAQLGEFLANCRALTV